MSFNNATYVEDSAFSSNADYNHLNGKLIDGINNNQQVQTNYGDTLPAISNQGPLSNFGTNEYYADPTSLFSQPLILLKELKSPFDIRYKTDYFPRGGQNCGKAQSPRYLHTFREKFTVPPNLVGFFLEVSLLTVPRIKQHHTHVNKFQLSHTDISVVDKNPFFIPLTIEQCQKGEIKVKLVIIKTPKNDLKNITSLPLFGEQTPPDWIAECKNVGDLEHTYELSRAQIAFSLGYVGVNNGFIRFPRTTVISNEIVEKEKSKPSGYVECPNCSHSFKPQEHKQKNKKRSASSSNSANQKRSSRRKEQSD